MRLWRDHAGIRARTALDISGPMLAEGKARATATGIANVDWRQADAATTTLDGFDLLTSAFGIMFFGDPVAAFANMRSSSSPGARMRFVCWRRLAENPWIEVPMNAVSRHLPPRPKPIPNAPGMFAFTDPQRVSEVLVSTATTSLREALAAHLNGASVLLPGAMWLVSSEPA